MKTIIAGGRNVLSIDAFDGINLCPWKKDITSLISGGATGADRHGEMWARVNNLSCVKYLPDWNAYGNFAGPIRNQMMVDVANALIAIWDGKSKGTLDIITKAKNSGLKVFIYYINTKEMENYNV